MGFFNSEIVQEELDEITRLQNLIYGEIQKFPSMNVSERLKHIELLEELLEKQEILYARLSLSDDPAAIKTKENIERYAVMMGISTDMKMNSIFDNVRIAIKNMKDYLSNA